MKICFMDDIMQALEDRTTCSCKHHDCPNNGTNCMDDSDELGIIQLPCIKDEPSLELYSACCLLGYLEEVCAFCMECA